MQEKVNTTLPPGYAERLEGVCAKSEPSLREWLAAKESDAMQTLANIEYLRTAFRSNLDRPKHEVQRIAQVLMGW